MAERARFLFLVLALVLTAPASARAQVEEEKEQPEQEPDPRSLHDRLRRGQERQPLPTAEPERPTERRGILAPEEVPPTPAVEAAVAPRGAPAGEPDSVMAALGRLEGYTVTTYSGSGAQFGADSGAVVLEGPAALERQGQNIAADSMLTFNRENGIVCGYGNPVLSGEDNAPINSDQICYDTELRMGMALGARTEFSQSGTWYVHGERVFTVRSDAIYSSGTDFTTCDLEVPHYHFHASRFKMINDRILVARDVTLNFGGVPVFWLPFLVQSLREGRRSGLLTPSLGVSDIVQTSSGNTREVRNLGVFWAINDYMGTELAMDWRSNNWIALRGRFDYRWTRQFLEGFVNAQQYFRDSGSRELMLRSDNGWQPGERTQVRVSAAYASSNAFVQQNTFDPQELNRTLQSNGSVRHGFEGGGSVSLGVSRDQQIMAERVTTTLPRLDVTLPGYTLASATIDGVPTELLWNGRASYSSTYDDRNEAESATLSDRDGQTQTAGVGSSIGFGNLSFSQGINAREAFLDIKPAVIGETDTTELLPESTTRVLDWNIGLSYRQDLIGSLRVTPHMTLNGGVQESPLTGDVPLTAPVALNFGASVEADIFGFWPGVGPFERFRHRFSPRITYGFRPEPDQTALQDTIFGATTRATNALTLSFNQTFEGKRPAEESADSADDTASDDRAAGEPRRLPGQQPVRLLSITTTALAYDFEAASRGEEGFTTTTIGNSIASDLLKNLSLNFTHSLFRSFTDDAGVEFDRTFDLHLEQLSASFGVSGESWLFRVLGLGGESEQETDAETALDTVDTESLLPRESNRGIVPGAASSRGMGGMNRVGSTGTWRADFDYSLRRPRDETLDENQSVNATVAFQPSENWSAGWSTNYSISDSEFQNNSVTLTRQLHRWQADFRILRAQNGNFSFEFEARLSDLPELRIPYDQRSRGNVD